MSKPPEQLVKDITVTDTMQLIDINGSKKNFQSDFMVSAVNPSKKFYICIVTQDDLDNGNINFESSETNGKYSRRVTFQKNVHINHYIAIKKHPQEKDENVVCKIIVKLQELPPEIEKHVTFEEDKKENIDMRDMRDMTDTENIEKNLNPSMLEEEREYLKKQLYDLRQSKDYQNLPDLPLNNENVPNVPNVPNIPIIQKKEGKWLNFYTTVGLIFLVIFFILLIKTKFYK